MAKTRTRLSGNAEPSPLQEVFTVCVCTQNSLPGCHSVPRTAPRLYPKASGEACSQRGTRRSPTGIQSKKQKDHLGAGRGCGARLWPRAGVPAQPPSPGAPRVQAEGPAPPAARPSAAEPGHWAPTQTGRNRVCFQRSPVRAGFSLGGVRGARCPDPQPLSHHRLFVGLPGPGAPKGCQQDPPHSLGPGRVHSDPLPFGLDVTVHSLRCTVNRPKASVFTSVSGNLIYKNNKMESGVCVRWFWSA